MADKNNRHALQYKGEVKSYSSKDILARLAAAQSESAAYSASGAAPPEPQPAPVAPVLPKAKGVPVATPKPTDKVENFHALQYKGQVKKFSSASVLSQFTHAATGGEVVPDKQVAAAAAAPAAAAVGMLIDLDDTPEEAPAPPDPSSEWAEFAAAATAAQQPAAVSAAPMPSGQQPSPGGPQYAMHYPPVAPQTNNGVPSAVGGPMHQRPPQGGAPAAPAGQNGAGAHQVGQGGFPMPPPSGPAPQPPSL